MLIFLLSKIKNTIRMIMLLPPLKSIKDPATTKCQHRPLHTTAAIDICHTLRKWEIYNQLKQQTPFLVLPNETVMFTAPGHIFKPKHSLHNDGFRLVLLLWAFFQYTINGIVCLKKKMILPYTSKQQNFSPAQVIMPQSEVNLKYVLHTQDS